MSVPASSVSAEDRLQLAYAVADAGRQRGPAMGINAGNNKTKYMSVARAHETGEAFAVHPEPGIVALDWDTPEGAAFDELLVALTTYRVPHVVVTSGTPGHRHGWLVFRGVDPDVRQGLLTGLKGLLGAKVVRDHRQRTRPPLSPHRDGRETHLIVPATVEDAFAVLTGPGPGPEEAAEFLAWLTARTQRDKADATRSPETTTERRGSRRAAPPVTGRRPLSQDMQNLLRDGDVYRRYPHRKEDRSDGSAVLQAIMTNAVASGWSYAEVTTELLDPRNRGGERPQRTVAEKGLQAGKQEIRRSYDTAVQHAPPPDSPNHGAFHDAHQAVLLYPWGPTAHSDRRVAAALLFKAERHRKTLLDASVRDVASWTGIRSPSTVGESLARVQDAGLISVRVKGRLGLATQWLVDLPWPGETLLTSEGVSAYWGGRCEECVQSVSLHDIWAEGPLARCRATWLLLTALPRTKDVLARELHVSTKTVEAHLLLLVKHGLIHREEELWLAPSPAQAGSLLRDVADQLGVSGAMERNAERHRAAQAAQREKVEESLQGKIRVILSPAPKPESAFYGPLEAQASPLAVVRALEALQHRGEAHRTEDGRWRST